MVSIDADGITTSIDQTTGVVTFSVGENVQLGEYVATITCGEADPIEITITVTAPTTTEIALLDNRGRPITSLTLGNIGTSKTVVITRTPNTSIDEVSYTIPQSEKFTMTIDQNIGSGAAEFTIKQTVNADPLETLDLVFTCGEATATLPVTPK